MLLLLVWSEGFVYMMHVQSSRAHHHFLSTLDARLQSSQENAEVAHVVYITLFIRFMV
jgi:hypothetical protein